jgi:tetratricopeptide (TPR) repeat protein
MANVPPASVPLVTSSVPLVTSSQQNRSFGLFPKTTTIANAATKNGRHNLSFQGFVTAPPLNNNNKNNGRSFVQESLRKFASDNNDKNDTSLSQVNNESVSSAFWTEWAEDEMKCAPRNVEHSFRSENNDGDDNDYDPTVSLITEEQIVKITAVSDKLLMNDEEPVAEFPDPSFAIPDDDDEEEEEEEGNAASSYLPQVMMSKKTNGLQPKVCLSPQEEEEKSSDGDDSNQGEDDLLKKLNTSSTSLVVLNLSHKSNCSNSSSTPTGPKTPSTERQLVLALSTSIRTADVVNMSQELSTWSAQQRDRDEEQAMAYTVAATELVQAKDYTNALEQYQLAIQCYRKEDTILASVNAAGCFRNMSTASLHLQRSDDAASYLSQAVACYVCAREAVEMKASEPVLTLDGMLLEDSRHNAPDVSGNASEEEEVMCLHSMILKTLHARAKFHSDQENSEKAIECLEQALKNLIHVHKSCSNDQSVRYEGVRFTPLSKDEHTTLLRKSLEDLGKLYRDLPGSFKGSLALFEDALDILQSRQEEEKGKDELVHSVSDALRYLSEIYFERSEMDKSVDALHDATAVKLMASGEPCSEALKVMDEMGAANEEMKNFDKALSCFEQSLFARCKFYGNTHIKVAKSLVNVARIMEKKDGVTEESVDLYRAANAIYAVQNECKDYSLDDEIKSILALIPAVIKQGRYEKAIADLTKCLALTEAKAEEEGADVSLDRAQILFDLGRAYMGMKEYEKATKYLMDAVKEVGNVSDEEVFKKLQQVEFMQREQKDTTNGIIDVTTEANKSVSLTYNRIQRQLQNNVSTFTLAESPLHNNGQLLQLNYIRPNVLIITRANDMEEERTEVELTTMDPRHAILYESFRKEDAPNPFVTGYHAFRKKQVKIAKTIQKKAIIARDKSTKSIQKHVVLVREKGSARIKSLRRSKLAQNIGKKIRKMKERRVQRSESGENAALTKWRVIRSDCLNRGGEKLSDENVDSVIGKGNTESLDKPLATEDNETIVKDPLHLDASPSLMDSVSPCCFYADLSEEKGETRLRVKVILREHCCRFRCLFQTLYQ